MNVHSAVMNRSAVALLALAAMMYGEDSRAATCGVAAPAPPPQAGGPGLQPNDTCAFPPSVLEPAQVTYPSADGFNNEASRFPDMQAWISFAEAVQPLAGAGGFTFIGWPTEGVAYSPQAKPSPHMSLLEFSKDATAHFAPHPSRQQDQRAQLLQKLNVHAKPSAVEAAAPDCRMGSQQSSHLNPTLVNYLHKENLWNIAGIKAYVAGGKKIVMPQGAIEIKSDWVEADAGSSAGYITMQDGAGKTWKMISMHVISKQLPNWTWATFEHKDNACYGKFLDPRDDFGFPNKATSPSAALQAVFAHYGVDPNVGNNYRLDGAQTDFTDDTGRPIVLGNSVTEAGFQTTSSCITCHARASVDANGAPKLSVFTPQGQSYNGPVNPTWYFDKTGKQLNFPADFMWSMAFCAAPDASSKSNCN